MASLFPYYVHSRYQDWKTKNNAKTGADTKSYVDKVLRVTEAKLDKKIQILTALQTQFYRGLNMNLGGDIDSNFNTFKTKLYNNMSQRMDFSTGAIKNPRGRNKKDQLEADILEYFQASRFSNTISHGIAEVVAKEVVRSHSTKNLQKVTEKYLKEQLRKMAGIMAFSKGGSGIQMQLTKYTPQEIEAACDKIARKMKVNYNVILNISDPKSKTYQSMKTGSTKNLAQQIYAGIAGQIGEQTVYLISEMFANGTKNVNIRHTGQDQITGLDGKSQFATADIVWEVEVPLLNKNGKSTGKTKKIEVGMQVKNWDIHGAKTYKTKGIDIGEYSTTSWAGAENQARMRNIFGTDKTYQALTYIVVNSLWFQQAGGIVGNNNTGLGVRQYSSNGLKLQRMMKQIAQVFQVLSMQVDTMGVLESVNLNGGSSGTVTLEDPDTQQSKTINVPAVFWIIKNTMFPIRWILMDLKKFIAHKRTEFSQVKGSGIKLQMDISGDALGLYQEKAAALADDPGDEYQHFYHPGAYRDSIVGVGTAKGKEIASKIKITYRVGLLQQALGRLGI